MTKKNPATAQTGLRMGNIGCARNATQSGRQKKMRNPAKGGRAVSDSDIDPKLGEDLGHISGLYIVSVPDAEITKARVLYYAERGVLIVPKSIVAHGGQQ